MSQQNIVQLQVVANGLGPLLQEVVFVGGATVSLYVTDPAATEVRPTDDVDCIIELASRGEYYALEDRLREMGFQNDTRERAPICRWVYQTTTVDIMPTDPDILGFSNRWYEEGIKEAVWHRLPREQSVRIFTPPYFVASKLEAFRNRGQKDIRTSTDFEDIIYLFDSRPSLEEEIYAAPPTVRTYIQDQCKLLLSSGETDEGITCALPYGSGEGRLRIIKAIMQRIANFLGV
jgi:predicted nucleotidyltransferase